MFTQTPFLASSRCAALLLSVTLLLTGCELLDHHYGDDEPELPSTTSDDLVIVPDFIQDADGNPPATPSTPLFETRVGAAILTPDGYPVTLADFSAAEGSIEVDCVQGGTRVRLDLSGLIPGGVYTMWNVPFEAPGPLPDEPDFNLSGLGAMGAVDGSQGSFTASATGTATFEAITPGGDLSEFGKIGNCALADEVEWHVVGAYHIDGQTHGPNLGPDGSVVEQFAFLFRGEDFSDE
ncbi:MAG: hypothetical protein ACR2GR_02245 [Rhodothermales bacterium]